MRSDWIRLSWLGLGLVGLVACRDPSPAPLLLCQFTSQCPTGFHCNPKGVCQGDVPCQTDDQCCLGERCDQLRCRARETCSPTAPCGDEAQICQSGLCVARPCTSTATCPAMSTCLGGRCERHVPCGGFCSETQACARAVDHCVALTQVHGQCQPGQMRSLLNDIEKLPEGCAALPEQTTCVDLPPLPAGRIGVPGVLASAKDHLVHVSYDAVYGDVVARRYPTAPPYHLLGETTLAGVPADAPVVGAVQGPRGGVLQAGPNVGEVIDVASDGQGRVGVAYRDTTNEALRWLEIDAQGKPFHDHMIRHELSIGHAVASALLADGRPVVLALTPATITTPSRLWLMQALLPMPMQGADWQSETLDTEPLAVEATPCGAGCPSGQVCALQGNSDICVTPQSGCSLCLPSQVCQAGSCWARHLPTPPLDPGVQGRGAWLDVAVTTDQQILVAAYSPAAGNLRLYRGHAGGPWTQTTVSGQSLGSKDFGRFVALIAGQDGRAIAACQDVDHGRLVLVQETASGIDLRVLDDGQRSDGRHRVGADCAILQINSGGLLVLHQDSRRADWCMVQVPEIGKPKQTAGILASKDAAGFASSALAIGSKALVVAATAWRVGADATVSSEVQLLDIIWSGE